MLYHVLSCYIMLYHAMSYYIILYHVISCYIMLYHIISYYIILYYIYIQLLDTTCTICVYNASRGPRRAGVELLPPDLLPSWGHWMFRKSHVFFQVSKKMAIYWEIEKQDWDIGIYIYIFIYLYTCVCVYIYIYMCVYYRILIWYNSDIGWGIEPTTMRKINSIIWAGCLPHNLTSQTSPILYYGENK